MRNIPDVCNNGYWWLVFVEMRNISHEISRIFLMFFIVFDAMIVLDATDTKSVFANIVDNVVYC